LPAASSTTETATVVDTPAADETATPGPIFDYHIQVSILTGVLEIFILALEITRPFKNSKRSTK
jgi:hypothetical protein